MDLSKLKKMEDVVRIGGKGSVRRKHKHVQSSPALEEKRLQATLAKLPLSQVPGIQQITLEMNDSSEILLMSPKVQGSVANNVFVLSGDLVHSNPSSSKSQPAARTQPGQPPQVTNQVTSQVTNQVPKKPKKPRNRIRCRNKRVQNALAQAEEAGKKEAEEVKEQDPQAGGDSPAKDDPRLERIAEEVEEVEEEEEEDFSEVGSNLSADSDNTKVPSDGSDMDQTIVGDDDSLGSWDAPTSGHDSDSNQADDECDGWADRYNYSDDEYPTEVPRPGTPRGPFSDDELDCLTPMNPYTGSSDEEENIQA